jgi:hypothetical protein
MERFHIITLLVATITLILLLTFSGILLHNDKRSQKFPPTHKKCPDGWTHTAGAGNDPGSCSAGDDNNKGTDGQTVSLNLDKDPCVNKQWADTKGVYWDGLTTYNGC